MTIKFIVNGKTFTTLCKTVKTANTYKIECTDAGKYHLFTAEHKEILSALISLYENNILPDYVEMDGVKLTPLGYIDLLFENDINSIIKGRTTYEKGFFHIYHGYASKRLLLEKVKSKVFKDWKSVVSSLSHYEFLDGLKWVCTDNSSEERPYTRAIALTPHGIVKLVAIHSETGYNYFDEKGKNFSGTYFTRKAITAKEKLFADENGDLTSFCKIILTSKDRI